MGYDDTKDKMLKEWEFSGLHVSVHSYDNGAPKLQIGPRTYKKTDGEVGFAKVGRLSCSETAWLQTLLPEIVAAMEKGLAKKQKAQAHG